MKGKKIIYTDQDIIEKSKQVKSIAGLLKLLGFRPYGGNYISVKKRLQLLKIDTSHWTGKGWNKGQQLKDWSQYSRVKNLRHHLIKKRGNICEVCKNSHWLEKPIIFDVHHKNGDRTNNNEDNLQVLCPNCHSFTDTFRGRKTKNANGGI